MKTIVQFGAGNIGRSLVGQLFARAGWRVVFVDAYAPVVEALKARGGYTVRIKDDLPPGAPDAVEITGVEAIHASDESAVAEAVSRADLLGTAVGPANLPAILGLIASGVAKRSEPITVLLCENLRNAASFAAAELAKCLPAENGAAARVGLVETSIGKMVPRMPRDVRERDPLEIWGEAYNKIVADRSGFAGPVPDVDGLVLKENFAAHVDRKLFIHNLGHATAAYHGFLAGKTFIWECMDVPEIRGEAEGAMWESGRALLDRYPDEFTEDDQREHIDDLLRRFHNKALGDTVFRVGCDLPRKLGRDDRCVGALRLCLASGVDPQHIVRAVGAALRFKATDPAGEPFPADATFHAALDANGPRAVLEDVAGLDPAADAALIERIEREYLRITI